MGPYETEENDTVDHGVDRPREVLTLEKVKEIMADRMEELNVAIKDAIWVTYFNVNERIANGFRRNRAFLAGGKKEGWCRLQHTHALSFLLYFNQMLHIVTLLQVQYRPRTHKLEKGELTFLYRWARHEYRTSGW